MDFDSAWCPACDRQIIPKRYTIQVPTTVQPPAPPPPPPSSPQRRTKGTIKQKHGLVAGTGRVRPNGTIKAPPSPPTVVYKRRTVIDQGPIPLYCSDECQMADIAASRSGPPINPASEESNLALPQRSFPATSSETESDDSSESSSLSSPPPPPPPPSIAKLAKMLNFPPLPPPPPTWEESEPVDPRLYEYNTGIMMASRLISSLCPAPAKPQTGRHRSAVEPRKPVPGWTDGSNAWRETVYSVAAPNSESPFNSTPSTTPRRSSRSATTLSAPAPSVPSHSASDDMIAKFSQSFVRRSESRTSFYPSTIASSPSSSQFLSRSPKRERSLVQPGAEGKLLVPDVKMKVHTGSSASFSSISSGPTSASSRRSMRSPLSASSDPDEDDDVSSFNSRRPAFETRSWSYDNVKTYPLMQFPSKKVKKLESRIIDGEETQVEIEVEEERKRLFLFAPKTISLSH